MLRERLQYLVDRYFSGACTEAEQKELARWIDDAQNDDALKELLEEAWHGYQPAAAMPDEMADRVLAAVFEQPQQQAGRVRRMAGWRGVAAAAAVLLLAAVAYLAMKPEKQGQHLAEQPARYRNEVPAGGNKALLTLGDGTVITLDSAANGLLARQGQVQVVKTANGELSYEGKGGFGDPAAVNTMRTPRGGEYRLTLRTAPGCGSMRLLRSPSPSPSAATTAPCRSPAKCTSK